MSDYFAPTATIPWDTESPDFDESVVKKVVDGESPYCTGWPEPYWDKRYLVFLYEDIWAPDLRCDDDMLAEVRDRATTVISTPIYDDEGRKNVIHRFEWEVLNVGPSGGLVCQRKIDKLYAGINFCNVFFDSPRVCICNYKRRKFAA